MLDIAELNASSLRNEYWEGVLHRFDPALFIRFDHERGRWYVAEYYAENVFPKFLFWLEDDKGEPKDFGQWAINKLNMMALNHQHKEKVGTNKWFDELEQSADQENKKTEEKIAEENLYMYKHDKLQWRKASRELLGRPASDVFAGFQYQPKNLTRTENVECQTESESTEIRRADSSGLQPDAGESSNSDR